MTLTIFFHSYIHMMFESKETMFKQDLTDTMTVPILTHTNNHMFKEHTEAACSAEESRRPRLRPDGVQRNRVYR